MSMDLSENVVLVDFDTSKKKSNNDNGDGGNMLEARVAKLESDVEYIKRDLSEVRSDVRELKHDISSLKTDMALVKQQMSDIAQKLVTKSQLETAIASSANKQILWTGSILCIGLGLALTAAKFIFS